MGSFEYLCDGLPPSNSFLFLFFSQPAQVPIGRQRVAKPESAAAVATGAPRAKPTADAEVNLTAGPMTEQRRSQPVYDARSEQLAAVRENALVVVVVRETGSDKTTLLAQYLYKDGYAAAAAGAVVAGQRSGGGGSGDGGSDGGAAALVVVPARLAVAVPAAAVAGLASQANVRDGAAKASKLLARRRGKRRRRRQWRQERRRRRMRTAEPWEVAIPVE